MIVKDWTINGHRYVVEALKVGVDKYGGTYTLEESYDDFPIEEADDYRVERECCPVNGYWCEVGEYYYMTLEEAVAAAEKEANE